MGNNKISNIEKLARPVDFSGLPFVGSCSPSDIDAPPIPFVLEHGALRKYMIGDFKESGRELPRGQRVLLVRHYWAFETMGYDALAFLAWHAPTATVIDAARTTIAQVYAGDDWQTPARTITLRQLYCRFFDVRE